MRLYSFLFLLLLLAHVRAQDKLSPKFDNALGRQSGERTGAFAAAVVSTSDFFRDYLGDVKVIDVHLASSSITFRSSYDLVMNTMLEDENVLFLDIQSVPGEEAVLSQTDFNYNRIRKAQHVYGEMAGVEVVVSVKERKYDVDDIDLTGKSRMMQLAAESISAHATDMATIIAGAGNTWPKYRGAAPQAFLSSSDFENLLPDDEELLTRYSIYAQNHSYGVGIENYYGVEAAAYDRSVYEQPEVVHVFSSGNAGNISPDQGQYAELPFANLTGNFKQAKNVLTVNAVDSSFAINTHNSRGPAYDGRLKPELTAYGGGGTSDAAALVSGSVALLQQFYLTRYGEVPSTSLIKALLIASADDIGPKGIDYTTGYGSVNTYHALQSMDHAWYQEVLVGSASTAYASFILPENVSSLKVAVSWVDPPASVNSPSALVNDVDAVLHFEDQEWLPWVLNPEPVESSLLSPAIRGADHINNTEFFTVEEPDAGEYTVELDLLNAGVMSQRVHVAWYYESSSFEWDYPLSSEYVIAGERNLIYWNATDKGVAGRLAFRIGDEEWQDVGEVELASDSYAWAAPDTSAYAQLKMTVDGKEYLSDTFFISSVPQMSVAYNCDEMLGLQWNSIAGATSYQVFAMEADSMQVVGETSDTVFSIHKSQSSFYAVAPVFGAVPGLRNKVLNYNFQGALCYINLFAADRYDETSVRLRLDLSTARDIERIEFTRRNNEEEDIIYEFEPGTKTSFTFYDRSPHQGASYYRAELFFSDGTSLVSDDHEVFMEIPEKVLLFPNPTPGDQINVLSSGEGQVLEVLDMQGNILLEQELWIPVEVFSINKFRAGLYLFRLLEGDQVKDSGKFIKY